MISVFVESTSAKGERRLNAHAQLSEIKNRLELVTGIQATSMQVRVGNRMLSDDTKCLADYGISDGQVLEVLGNGVKMDAFSNLSQIPKFEISEQEYDRRQDSVRQFLRSNKLGQYAAKNPIEFKVDHIKVGARCIVRSADSELERRGQVRYLGTADFKEGVWVGIELDEPLGKHDGSVEGQKYFDARPKHGIFVRPDSVTCGNFEIVDPFAESDVDDESEM